MAPATTPMTTPPRRAIVMTTLANEHDMDAHAAQLADRVAASVPAGVDTTPADRPARPYWQTEPCPPWCFNSDGAHGDDDHPTDRIHFSRWSGEVILTLLPAEVSRTKGRAPLVEPPELRVSVLLQHREAEPRVVLATEGMPEGKDIDADLTVVEARQLVAYLTEALRLAEQA